jgi:16S rRNA (cytosine1402-N4)-methyltransferase
MEFKHKSVLLYETVDELNIKPDGIYVDGTLGGGGHSYEIASRLSDKGRLIGIDQDEDAIKAASKRLEPFKDRVTIVRNNYCNMDKVLNDLSIDKVDGIMFHRISLTQRREASLIMWMQSLICVWTRGRK